MCLTRVLRYPYDPTADNLWLQGVAIVLSQVSLEFGVKHYQFLTFSLYVGLIIGALLWGILADVVGRRLSFNATLFLCGIFGLCAGAANNFVTLSALVACMGIGLGGNLPVDGMVMIEVLPASKQSLLSVLAVFWSVGQAVASLVAWPLISNYSCKGSNIPADRIAGQPPCLKKDNWGWRYCYFTYGGLTLVCFLSRFVLVRMPESPKYLISQGQDDAAVEAMREIARRNGKDLPESVLSVRLLREAAGLDPDLVYEDENQTTGGKRLLQKAEWKALPRRLSPKRMLQSSVAHIKPLFNTPRMGYTMSALIFTWAAMGIAYPIFFAFLPTWLSSRYKTGGANSVYLTYRNYVIVSLCSLPGALLAAALIQLPRMGRKGGIAVGCLLTGIFMFVFTTAKTPSQNLAFSVITAFTSQIYYPALYTLTPELMPAPHRGTGDALCSAANRLLGLMAPIVTIYAENPSAPLYSAASLVRVLPSIISTVVCHTRGARSLSFLSRFLACYFAFASWLECPMMTDCAMNGRDDCTHHHHPLVQFIFVAFVACTYPIETRGKAAL